MLKAALGRQAWDGEVDIFNVCQTQERTLTMRLVPIPGAVTEAPEDRQGISSNLLHNLWVLHTSSSSEMNFLSGPLFLLHMGKGGWWSLCPYLSSSNTQEQSQPKGSAILDWKYLCLFFVISDKQELVCSENFFQGYSLLLVPESSNHT